MVYVRFERTDAQSDVPKTFLVNTVVVNVNTFPGCERFETIHLHSREVAPDVPWSDSVAGNRSVALVVAPKFYDAECVGLGPDWFRRVAGGCAQKIVWSRFSWHSTSG
jgi:hypothetical protein